MHMVTMKRMQGLLLSTAMLIALPMPMMAQTDQAAHDRAQAEQNAYDRQHHNTLKTVGGTAAAGALIGGAAGGGAGYVGDRVRKHYGTQKRERYLAERRRHHYRRTTRRRDVD